MNKSALVSREILTSNCNWREKPISKFTPHHVAVANASAETIARNFEKNGNSANYVIGNDGEIILCVPETYRAWTSDSPDNDNMAVTVEVCNSTGAPEWRVSDAALESLINLGVDICKRYNLPPFKWTGDASGTLTIHKMFYATACPGPYLESKMPYVADEIAKRLKGDNDMVYTINLEELKDKGYTEVRIIMSETINEQPKEDDTLKVGDTVKMSKGAPVYGHTYGYADFVYDSTLYVRKIEGDKITVSTVTEGPITGPVHSKYLEKV